MNRIVSVVLFLQSFSSVAQEMIIDKREIAVGVFGGAHWGMNYFFASNDYLRVDRDNVQMGLRPHIAASLEYVLKGYEQRYTKVKLGVTTVQLTFDWILPQTAWSRNYASDGSYRQLNRWNQQFTWSALFIKKQSSKQRRFGLGIGPTFSILPFDAWVADEHGNLVFPKKESPQLNKLVGLVPVVLFELNGKSQWSAAFNFSWPLDILVCDCDMGTSGFTWAGHKIAWLRWCSNNWPLLKAGVVYHIRLSERGYK
ncbi:MAG: hypothetical protein SH856_00505 [Flavobacteriales bacterium]|nr:hypothetical protein [Flavobacteriales bacterium]